MSDLYIQHLFEQIEAALNDPAPESVDVFARLTEEARNRFSEQELQLIGEMITVKVKEVRERHVKRMRPL